MRAAPTPHEKAQQIATAVDWQGQAISVHRDGLTLVLDAAPAFVRNKQGVVIGIDAMVRLFDGVREVPIDPHRIICNPPLVPRANLTYEEGALELVQGDDDDAVEARFVGGGRIVAHLERVPTQGVAYRRIVGAPDPRAAYFEAVFDSVIGVPNARGFRTRGTVSTVYATAPGGDGMGYGASTTYATARSTISGTMNDHVVGQNKSGTTYSCFESAVIFGTSGIPDTDDVSDVVHSMDGSSDVSTTNFNAKIVASSYDGGPFAVGDWVAGASLGALTELASWDSVGYSAGYNAFTSAGAAFNSAINKTGNTALLLFSDRHAAGTVPAADEVVIFTDADAAGTTTDPKLDITHAGTGGAVVALRTLLGVGV